MSLHQPHRYISTSELHALKQHQYSVIDHSILKQLFLGALWDYCVELFPRWFAPNLMTFVGFIFLLVNFVMSMYIGFDNVAPKMCFLICALNIWLYQIMDNIDGKQARLTGSVSPLGELLDHGCDSLFVLLNGVLWCRALDFGIFQSFFLLMTGHGAFFLSHWEEFHTNTLVMGTWDNPTEVQIIIVITCIISGILGPDFWHTSIYSLLGNNCSSTLLRYAPFLQFPISISIQQHIVFWIIIGTAIALFGNISRTFHSFRRFTNKTSYWPLISSLIAFSSLNLLFILWLIWSPITVLKSQPLLVICISGIIHSYLCNRIILARICKTQPSVFYNILLVPVLAVLNAAPLWKAPIIPECYLVPILLFLSLFGYLHYVFSVVLQLRKYLGIEVFRIKKPSSATR